MKIETPLIALVLASVVFTSLFTIMFSLAEDNNKDISLNEYTTQNGTSLQTAFTRINETKANMKIIQEDFKDTSVSDTGSVFSYLTLGFKVGKQMLGSLNVFSNILNIVSEIIGIPPLFVGTLVSIVIIIMIISIIMLLLGRTY